LREKKVVGHSVNHDFKVLDLPELSIDGKPKMKFSDAFIMQRRDSI
jgi:hypothetical protein